MDVRNFFGNQLPKTNSLKSGKSQDIDKAKMNSTTEEYYPFADIQEKTRTITYKLKEDATWEQANKWLEDTWNYLKGARWIKSGNLIFFWIEYDPEDDEDDEESDDEE